MSSFSSSSSRLSLLALLSLSIALFCLSACLVSVAEAKSDYYELLGVKRNSSIAQIKKAYRKLASKLHPDVNPGKEAEQRWMEITRAYEVLSDAQQREIYDAHGEEGVNQSAGQQQHQGATINFGGPGGFTINFGGQQGEQDHEPPKGPDLVANIFVTLRDLYLGKQMEIIRVTNDKQEGRGTRKCNCRQQMVTKQQGYFIQQVLETKCDTCPSIDFIPSTRTLEVDIEKGMRDGTELTFSEGSDPVMDGSTGNLILRIKQTPDPFFRRINNDLYCEQHISLVQSLVGFDYTIKHLDGHEVRLKRTEPTKPGFMMKVPNEGMPKTEDPYYFGDLYVTFHPVYPEALTPEQAEAIVKAFPDMKK